MLVQSVIVIGLVWLTTFTCASPGDESTKYQLCLRKCIIEASGEEFDSASEEAVAVLVANPDCFFKKFEPSFLKSRYLDILWDTEAHCRYFCMHRTEKDELDFAATRGLARPRPQKYYGKWPFLRLFGMQEFFSVIFSLCNLVVNIYGHMFIFLPVVSSHYPYQGILLVFFLFQCLAWIFSAIFHARDTRLTERFDYFFAIDSINLDTNELFLVDPNFKIVEYKSHCFF